MTPAPPAAPQQAAVRSARSAVGALIGVASAARSPRRPATGGAPVPASLDLRQGAKRSENGRETGHSREGSTWAHGWGFLRKMRTTGWYGAVKRGQRPRRWTEGTLPIGGFEASAEKIRLIAGSPAGKWSGVYRLPIPRGGLSSLPPRRQSRTLAGHHRGGESSLSGGLASPWEPSRRVAMPHGTERGENSRDPHATLRGSPR